ncbi:MAG: polymer-forming cytoskeletal protein [Thermodesulfobacteriota bacterium]|nr:polymer-forming cytoskeletal protein [Thermodesulfobacteriota bacterium]
MKKIKDEIKGFLGADTEFEGKLSFTGTVRIDGRFKGDILAEGSLIVGETSIVEADIRVLQIIINGEVRGDIVAESVIEIRAPAKVIGNINAPSIIIQQGAVFEGNCIMQKKCEGANNNVVALPKNS